MSKGFGSGSSKKRRNVKKLYLDNQFASRVVPSLLKNLSLSELIANDDKEYIRIIRRLYEQRELLKKFKDKLGIQKEKNKIYNSEFFVRDLEKLYLSIKD